MSETTEVKGQFGLGQSGGMGKKLKIYFLLQMSYLFKPTIYNNKAKQNEWINNIFLTHDLICYCEHPQRHLLAAIAEKQENIQLSKEEKKNLFQCLTTTEETTPIIGDTPEDIDELGLDAVFAEDFGEDAG